MTERLDDSGAGERCWGQIAAVIKREEGDVCRVMMPGALLITTPCGRAVLVVRAQGREGQGRGGSARQCRRGRRGKRERWRTDRWSGLWRVVGMKETMEYRKERKGEGKDQERGREGESSWRCNNDRKKGYE